RTMARSGGRGEHENVVGTQRASGKHEARQGGRSAPSGPGPGPAGGDRRYLWREGGARLGQRHGFVQWRRALGVGQNVGGKYGHLKLSDDWRAALSNWQKRF